MSEQSNKYELTASEFESVRNDMPKIIAQMKNELDQIAKIYPMSEGSMQSETFDMLLRVVKKGNDLHLRMCVG